MADFWSGQVGNNYCPQIRLSASVTSYNDTSDTISWTLDYVAHGYGFYTSGNRQWYANIDGQQWSGTANVYGATGTVRLGSGTKVVAKTHNDKNVSCSASMSLNGYWNGAYINWAECSGSVFTGKKTTYTVSYNANGGSGAPGSQTKWHGETLILSGTRPSRTGYNFSRWNTNTSNTGTAYSPGGSYTANSGATLYAIWSPYTYTVSYNANGGTGAPGNQTKTYGVNLKLSSTRPTRTNYNFLGWGVSASSTSVSYSPGGTYSANTAITLYAVWQLAYVAPRITNLASTRSNSSGTASDSGSYAKVSFSWATDRTVNSIKIQYKPTTSTSWTSTTVTGSGTSGTVSKVLSNINTEYAYDIRVTVADSGGSSSASSSVSGMTYMIDFKSGGNGVAIGQAASSEGFSVGWTSNFKDVNISGKIKGIELSGYYDTPTYYEIARSTANAFHSGVYASIFLEGTIGGFTGSHNGSIGVHIPLREPSGKVRVAYSSGQINFDVCNIIVTLDSDNFVHVYARMNQYAMFSLTLKGNQFITLSNPTGSSSVNGTTIFSMENARAPIDAIYPVGSIYMSVNSTNPGLLFGGTWVEIQGRFLFGRDGSHAAGSTGGEASHKLTVAEMPVHSHPLGPNVQFVGSGEPRAWNIDASTQKNYAAYGTTAGAGGNASHNNMPPYLSVYIWKRTA